MAVGLNSTVNSTEREPGDEAMLYIESFTINTIH